MPIKMPVKKILDTALLFASLACCFSADARAARLYADLSAPSVKGSGITIVPVRNFEWSREHRGWRVTGVSGAFAVRFGASKAGRFKLKVRHLASEHDNCQGGGYAPVTITANGATVVRGFDPASGHGGTHAWVTDTWPLQVRRGGNNVIFSVSRQCGGYVIQRVDLFPPAAAPAAGSPARREAPDALSLYNGALASHGKGDYTSAIISLNKAISLNPDLEGKAVPWLADAYARRGYAYYSRGEYARSVADLEEAVRLDPGSETFRKSLAAAKARLREEGPVARRVHGQARPAPDRAAVEELRRLLLRAAELEALYGSERGGYTSDLGALSRLSPTGGDFRDRLMEAIDPGSFAVEPAGEGFRVSAVLRGSGGFRASVSSSEITALAKPVKTAPEKEPGSYKKTLLVGLLILTPLMITAFLFPWRRLSRSRSSRKSPGSGLSAPSPARPAEKPFQQEGDPAAPEPGLFSGQSPDAYSAAAAGFASDGNYRQALETLLKKPRPQLTLGDYNLCFELYLNLEDASRAASLLSTISAEIAERHPVQRGLGLPVFEQRFRRGSMPSDAKTRPELLPGAYLGLARLARSKSRPELSPELCRMASDCLLTTFSPSGAPRKYYDLAAAFEDDGELKYSLELFQLIAYEDSAQRAARIKLKAAVAPELPPAASKQASPPPSPDAARQVSGKLLSGRYELGEALGAGGMAVIYRGRDTRTGEEVAVKLMHAYLKEYPEEFERFRREAKIVGALHHPNIVGIRDVVEQEGEVYLVFEYVEGKTLYAMLKEQKRLPLEDCKLILGGVCDAIHYAHENNVIHRDLKPANVMMAAGNKAMVMDFGLSCELRDGLTRVSHQTMSGTPAYMAPEQQAGVVKREADIYSMGICLYEMLTGSLPFDGLDVMKQKQLKDYREAGSQLPWLPSGVDEVISRALEPEPSLRYADALDFWRALKDL